MLIRRLSVENVRSFFEHTELLLDGQISIIIGPNGGGKTNILDAVVIVLRKYIYASKYAAHAPIAEHQERFEIRVNDSLSHINLERHSAALDKDQIIEIDIEVSDNDLSNMRSMKDDRDRLLALTAKKYINLDLNFTSSWNLENINPGVRFRYRILNGVLDNSHLAIEGAHIYLQYLQMHEMVSQLREEFELAPLATTLMYFPVNRGASGFQSGVELAGFNQFEVKRNNDMTYSRSGGSSIQLAVGRLAQTYRLLQEKSGVNAMVELRESDNLKELTVLLSELGYDWKLETVSPLRNQYDIRLKKQGITFSVNNASSGEKELLIYLFTIFALNVRNALIIVDEPELHLHPKWQKTLMQLFIRLSESTGNQFLLATHSPTFVSPSSIQYVSRVFSQNQRSKICRIDSSLLPDAKHLLNIINSQNNERMFFADKIVLVEGLSDRIFFEKLIEIMYGSKSLQSMVEVISVDGKALFSTYGKILAACQIPYSIISDLDYVEQVGTPSLKSIFKINAKAIKKDVIDNVKSVDANALVAAVDKAIEAKSWIDAEHIWTYIKSRRKQLRDNMNHDELQELFGFINNKYNEGIYILKKGALEAYLPEEYASKDIEKLIQFLSHDSFFNSLPVDGVEELKKITKGVLQI